MKKIKFLALFTALMIVSTLGVFAQEVSETLTLADVATNGISSFFISLSALVPLVMLVAAWVNDKVKANTIFRQVIAWVIALVFSYAGFFLKLGYFADIEWWHALVYGFSLGLASNGFFDISVIESILKAIGFGKYKTTTTTA